MLTNIIKELAQLAMFLCIMAVSLRASQALAESDKGIASLKIGDVEIFALQDHSHEMDRSLFSGAEPKDIDAIWPKSPSGEFLKAPASINVFVIKTPTQIMLVDAGLGEVRPNSLGQTLALLEKIGLKPEAVSAILLTHMHTDHIGGLIDKDGKRVFANAKLYLSTPEKDFWVSDNAKDKAPERIKGSFALPRQVLGAYSDQVRVFDFGQELVPGVTAINAAGHTPGQTVYLLQVGDQKLLFCGDVVHAVYVQSANPSISAQYDMDMPHAVEVRRTLLKKAAEENMLVFGAHIPFPGVGHISVRDNGFTFTPGD